MKIGDPIIFFVITKERIVQKMSELKNSIYSAVVRITEELERDRIYTGNGHHLAQRIAQAVAEAVEDLQKKKAHGKAF